MIVHMWSYSPVGERQTILRVKLTSGQPLPGDNITVVLKERQVTFIVIDREWLMEHNPDGGGMVVRLVLQVTQIGAVEFDGAAAPDGGPATDGPGGGSGGVRTVDDSPATVENPRA